MSVALGQGTQPLVAVHDSEYTRALANMTASGSTPSGSGTTGKQWWPTNWNYFVMPESVKEMLRSDGTAFKTVGDSNILSGDLLVNGQPKYPIVISLAAEAIRNEEIAAFTNYVAAGGFLFVGSSSFTRNTNGTARGNFAFANEMGLNMVGSGLNNWGLNTTFTKAGDHRTVSHIPGGFQTWRLPQSAEETSWDSTAATTSVPTMRGHLVWQVQPTSATVLAFGDNYPCLMIKPYGRGYFIYYAPMQPLIGHGGWSPGMYSYVMFRRAIEWAYETQSLPLPKLSPWPYQYDSAYLVRHDLESFANLISVVKGSAQYENANGAKGDYYFCTGALREDMANPNTVIADLRTAMTSYGATIGPHNGGLKNANFNLTHNDYNYWHWSIDEPLDITPPGYASGKAYSLASLSNSFQNIETWLSGLMSPSMRVWCAPYFNATREDSVDIQSTLNVKVTGDIKLSPFPTWAFSTRTAGKRYGLLNQPVSEWFTGTDVAQSMEWHTSTNTLRAGVDSYYNLGALVNFYSHSLSSGEGQAGDLAQEYVRYCANTNLHPRLWPANAITLYQWWLARSNAQINFTYATNNGQAITTATITGATHTNTTVEIILPPVVFTGLQVFTNGILASANTYRTNGQTLKLRVGTTITNAVISYTPCVSGPATQIYSENFDGVTAPALPSGWTTTKNNNQSLWVTQTTVKDSAPNAAFSPNPASVGVNELVSPAIALPDGRAQLSFRNYYDLEAGFDGAVLEIKIAGGAWVDIIQAGGSFANGGYTHQINSSYANPLADRQAWSGDSGGFISTLVDLPAAAANKTVQFRWRCGTDNGTADNGWRIDTISVSNRVWLCNVTYTNTAPPVLPAQSNRTNAELTLLTVANAATDPDQPGNSLNYQLLNAPANSSIDGNGLITFTPDETQGPGIFTIKTRVTDFGGLSATNTFDVTVTDVNSAPTFPAQTNRTQAEGLTLIVTNTATDSDFPANALTYTLLAAPAGAGISANGVITWPTDETTGPSTSTFTTRVQDNGSPAISVTNTFIVTVTEINSAPVLPAQNNRAIAELTLLTVNNAATDSDLPANTLSYSLLNAPSGAAISPVGIITWTPDLLGTGNALFATNLFRTVVTDNGTPALSATNSFSAIVGGNPKPTPVLDSTALVAEGCAPTNNAVDNGETVTVSFVFKNVGLVDNTNLVITLLNTNGILGASGAQNYGALTASGASVSRAFSFTAAGVCGSNITATLQMQDGSLNFGTATVVFPLGAIGTVITQNFDSVTAPALPTAAGWSTIFGGVGMVGWYTTNATVDTAPNAVFSRDPATVATNLLISPTIVLPLGSNQLTFRHRYDLEFEPTDVNKGYDGGVLEIKIGSGVWQDILDSGGSFVSGGYTRTISDTDGSAIAGRDAWSGSSGAFVTTLVNLPASAAGQSVQLRWLCATDIGGAGGGWRIDSIGVMGRVCCNSSPPILPSQNNRTLPEQTTLTVTNTALDPGSPVNALNYSLLNPPSGAQISTNGIITWTPTEAQGPGTNVFITVAVNSGAPSLAATNQFTVTVTESNSPPVLPVVGQKSVAELSTLTVTNTANDSDLPANVLSYQLINPPANANINALGIITFNPNESQGPATNTFTTVVNDGTVSVTNSFTVVVTEVNTAPTLPVIGQKSVAELSVLIVTNTASDSDLPANTLTYQLINPPSHASINAQGVITFSPDESQGPATNTFNTVVNDGAVSVTNSFVVVVTEVNTAPTLPVIGQKSVAELATLTVTNTASDSDLPANTLTYQLISPPPHASINAQGIITFSPDESQGPGTNLITTAVNDGSVSVTNSFTVIVTEVNTAPTLPVVGQQAIAELATLTLTNTATDTDLPANLLTYSLLNPPAHASINPISGVITFTPDESQGPGTNTITTVVSDGQLSATNNFLVTISEQNTAPTLPLQSDRTMPEQTTLTVTNTASDSDLPANVLAYSLLNPPAHASIDPISGVITFTPDESQGPGTNTITTVVNDGALSVTNSFTVIVTEANTAPTLPTLVLQSIAEGSTLLVTNTASDSDLPANTLNYSLAGAPGYASINTQGIITLAPLEADGPATNTFNIIVSDGLASATNSLTVIVTEVNTPPVLPVISEQVIAELTTLTLTNTATDADAAPDLPANTLTYSLLNPPANVSIGENGIITFTPDESQGPGTNIITTVVSDGALSATNSFTVIVAEVNTPPTLPVIGQQTIAELTTFTLTNTASDSDLPANTLTYSLLNPPANAGIDAAGVITFTPDESQGPGTNVFTTVVSDGALSATNSFAVIVTEVNTPPTLPPQPERVVKNFATLTVTNRASDADLPAALLSYTLLNCPANATIDSSGVITFTPAEGHCPRTNLITTVATDEGGLSATNSFAVVVTQSPPPVIQSITHSDGIVEIVWSAVAGENYRLQFLDDFNGTNWTDSLPDVQATGETATRTDAVGLQPRRFYRVILLP